MECNSFGLAVNDNVRCVFVCRFECNDISGACLGDEMITLGIIGIGIQIQLLTIVYLLASISGYLKGMK